MTPTNNVSILSLEEQANSLLSSQQWGELVLFIEHHSDLFISEGKQDTVRHWLNSVPKETKFNNTYILWLTISLIPSTIESASHYFSQEFKRCLLAKDYDLSYSAWTSFSQIKFYYLDRFSDVLVWLKQADLLLNRASLPQDPNTRAAFCTAYFNALLLCRPDKKQLTMWAGLLSSELLHAQNHLIKIAIYNQLIFYNIWVGNMHQARLLRSEALGIVHNDYQDPFGTLMHHTMFAMVSWLDLHNDEALHEVQKGIEYGNKIHIPLWHAQLLSHNVYAHIASADFKQANISLHEMAQVKNDNQLLDNSQYHYIAGYLRLNEGYFTDAETHLIRAAELAVEAQTPFPEAVIRICLAQTYFSQNKLVESVSQLVKAQWIGRRMGSKHIRYGCLLAQSWVMHCWNNPRMSSFYLKKALKLAAKEHYIVIPGWPHAIMQQLLEKALHENIETEHVRFLITQHHITPTGDYPAHPDWPWKITISCLNQFEITIQGQLQSQIGKSQKKPLELIQLLTFYPEGLSKYKIADYLYPDNDADKAMQALDTTIFRARKLLQDKQAILSTQGEYHLNPKLCHSNIMSLNNAINKKPNSLTEAKVLTIFEQITQLCKNMDSVHDDYSLVWLTSKRQSMRLEIIKYLNQCAEEVSLKNKVAIYNFIIQLDPTIETSYQSLIITYQQLDQQIEAHKVYLQCEHIFKDTFNLPPSQKTINLMLPLS